MPKGTPLIDIWTDHPLAATPSAAQRNDVGAARQSLSAGASLRTRCAPRRRASALGLRGKRS